jgi:hypothetical protein
MEELKKFHGYYYCEGEKWDCRVCSCCKLCKTTSNVGKFAHKSRGLCGSCYKRLSIRHRLYNDSWIAENMKAENPQKVKETKKAYKNGLTDLVFFDEDINTLLPRYGFKCAYCEVQLQVYNSKDLDALQIEYKLMDDRIYELVPVCRSCNCSKKNLISEDDLKYWARGRGISYPFRYKRFKVKV